MHIGVFGAIRPFKNHLVQAVAAIKFANSIDKTLYFHINGSRLEQKGEEVYKNLKALFKNNDRHKLVDHKWLDHMDFISLIAKMDLGMQVSFTESFNIVTADFVKNNIPIVVSKDIAWMNRLYKVSNPNSVDDIVHTLKVAWHGKKFNLQRVNRIALDTYNEKSLEVWKTYLGV